MLDKRATREFDEMLDLAKLINRKHHLTQCTLMCDDLMDAFDKSLCAISICRFAARGAIKSIGRINLLGGFVRKYHVQIRNSNSKSEIPVTITGKYPSHVHTLSVLITVIGIIPVCQLFAGMGNTLE